MLSSFKTQVFMKWRMQNERPNERIANPPNECMFNMANKWWIIKLTLLKRHPGIPAASVPLSIYLRFICKLFVSHSPDCHTATTLARKPIQKQQIYIYREHNTIWLNNKKRNWYFPCICAHWKWLKRKRMKNFYWYILRLAVDAIAIQPAQCSFSQSAVDREQNESKREEKWKDWKRSNVNERKTNDGTKQLEV